MRSRLLIASLILLLTTQSSLACACAWSAAPSGAHAHHAVSDPGSRVDGEEHSACLDSCIHASTQETAYKNPAVAFSVTDAWKPVSAIDNGAWSATTGWRADHVRSRWLPPDRRSSSPVSRHDRMLD
jgi:hypothetical protein